MKVFLSHSGTRSSKLAKLFQEWLPYIIQNVETWISDDIKKGKLWRQNIATALEETKIGIICLTQTNLDSPWILFEAGALSKTHDALVGTFLLDNEPSDITGPLSDFQHTVLKKDDVRKLIFDINDQLILVHEKPVEKSRLNKTFDKYWKEFEEPALEIKSEKEEGAEIKRAKRSSDDILYEILDRIRRIDTIRDSSGKVLPLGSVSASKSTINKEELLINDLYHSIRSLEGQIKKEEEKLSKMMKMKADKNQQKEQKQKITELSKKLTMLKESILECSFELANYV